METPNTDQSAEGKRPSSAYSGGLYGLLARWDELVAEADEKWRLYRLEYGGGGNGSGLPRSPNSRYETKTCATELREELDAADPIKALARALDALKRSRTGHPLDYERHVMICEDAERVLRHHGSEAV